MDKGCLAPRPADLEVLYPISVSLNYGSGVLRDE
jgi:hypothetical protein